MMKCNHYLVFGFGFSKLKIDWILPTFELIVSEKDKNHPALEDALLFDYENDLYD